MTYCFDNIYCCLWGKRIGRPIRIPPLRSWRIALVIHIAAYGANVSVDQYVFLGLRHDILLWQYVLMPTGRTYWSTNTYFWSYPMTYCYGNAYCCLRGKHITRSIRISTLTNCCLWSKCTSRPVRISVLTPWHIVRAIYSVAFEAKQTVDQYVFLRLRHDILFGRYILLTTG